MSLGLLISHGPGGSGGARAQGEGSGSGCFGDMVPEPAGFGAIRGQLPLFVRPELYPCPVVAEIEEVLGEKKLCFQARGQAGHSTAPRIGHPGPWRGVIAGL